MAKHVGFVAMLSWLMLAVCVDAQPVFRLTHTQADWPVGGRLVVYFVDEASTITAAPSSAPFFSNPQPMGGVDVERWAAGDAIEIDSFQQTFPVGGIPPGTYRVQAVLDRVRLSSDWSSESGNLFSGVASVSFAAGESPVVELSLDSVVDDEPAVPTGRVEFRQIETAMLSNARLAPVSISVGVIRPIGFREGRRYPVVYEVPGFGGTHESAVRRAASLAEAEPGSPTGQLARSAFWVVLDPDGPNGHHLFLDSRANGPVGRALVEEVVPAVDKLYPTIRSAETRLLRGHSSGGWSVIHLALDYPQTFAGAWSSAPDPLDFRAFQSVNIYEDTSMYADAAGVPRPSFTDRLGNVLMTIAEENAMESVLGPVNTSGQQWDSWQAAFGPVDDEGRPARLHDEITGEIDPKIAARYRTADLSERVRRQPGRLARLARDRVRVIVGEADEFDLDRGVELFVETLLGHAFEGERGWYAFVPGATHGSVLRSPAADRLYSDMQSHIDRHVREQD